MVTVYNMMSGTLQKDVKATDTPEQFQTFTNEQEIYRAELQLQEIDFEDTTTKSVPAHLMAINAVEFLKTMK